MKKQFKLLVLGILVSGSQYLMAQTARVQVIHNCADAAAATVDIWVAGGTSPLIDNLQFRAAFGFTDLPAADSVFGAGAACGPWSTGKQTLVVSVVALTGNKRLPIPYRSTKRISPQNLKNSKIPIARPKKARIEI